MDYDTKPMTYIAKSKNLALTFQEYYVYLRKFEYSIVFSPNFYEIAWYKPTMHVFKINAITLAPLCLLGDQIRQDWIH